MVYQETRLLNVGDWVEMSEWFKKTRTTDDFPYLDNLRFGKVSAIEIDHRIDRYAAIVEWLLSSGSHTSAWHPDNLAPYEPTQEEVVEWLTASLSR